VVRRAARAPAPKRRLEAEILEIDALLEDARLSDECRAALEGAQQALRNVLYPETWHTASQTFYRINARPIEAESKSRH
jgi:hypothetical protein